MVGFDVFDFFDEGVEAGLEFVGVTGRDLFLVSESFLFAKMLCLEANLDKTGKRTSGWPCGMTRSFCQSLHCYVWGSWRGRRWGEKSPL